MRALIQRVSEASVTVDSECTGKIGRGLLVFLGVKDSDTENDVFFLVNKLFHLRIFEDDEGKFNQSLIDIDGEVLVVSQFTLYADTRKGRRPSFIAAAPPEKAERLYDVFVKEFRKTGLKVKTGKFQAKMAVHLTNDGPVTLMVKSE